MRLPGAVSVQCGPARLKRPLFSLPKGTSRKWNTWGHYEDRRRENRACPCADLRLPLSEPFTDRQPLRPCRGKIKPVLSGFPYCTWPRPRSISVIPMCGEVPARPLPLTAPASSAGSILQAVSTTCPVPRHRALQPVRHHPVLRGKAVGHYLFHRNL